MRKIDLPDGKRAIVSVWGEDAHALLQAIGGKEVRKKRRTILLLGAYRLAGLPLTAVFKRADAVSSGIHYGKWKKLPEYKAALDHILGLATTQRDEELDDLEADGVRLLESAVVDIKSLTQQAVNVLRDGMEAEQRIIKTYEGEIIVDETVPDYAERRQSASNILDRVQKTAKNQKTDHSGSIATPITIIDYGLDDDDEGEDDDDDD